MINYRKQVITSILFSFFLFQYTFATPLSIFINPMIVISILTILISIVIVLINFNQKGYKNVAIFVLLFCCFILFKLIIDKSINTDFLPNFIAILFPISILFFYPIDMNLSIKFCFKLSIFSVFILFCYPLYNSQDYMRFGYAMAIPIIFIYIGIKYLKLKRNYLLCSYFLILISFIEMVLCGSRGAVLTVLLFIFSDFILLTNKKCIVKLICLGLFIIILFNIGNIIEILDQLANMLGIKSYAIAKYKLQFTSGFISAASGRFDLYMDALNQIATNPFWGSTITAFMDDDFYFHNIFLQIAHDLGIIVLLIFLFIILYSFILINSKVLNCYDRIMLCALFSISMGRLMFSSVFWRRPEFWMYLCFVIVLSSKYLQKKYKSRNISSISINSQ